MIANLIEPAIVQGANGRLLKRVYNFTALEKQLQEDEILAGLFFCYLTCETLASVLEDASQYSAWQDALDAGTHRMEGFFAVKKSAMR